MRINFCSFKHPPAPQFVVICCSSPKKPIYLVTRKSGGKEIWKDQWERAFKHFVFYVNTHERMSAIQEVLNIQVRGDLMSAWPMILRLQSISVTDCLHLFLTFNISIILKLENINTHFKETIKMASVKQT